jgi:hypothetical protein
MHAVDAVFTSLEVSELSEGLFSIVIVLSNS